MKTTQATLTIEIRPGEGGEDAQLLVAEQSAIYQAYAGRHGLQLQVGHGTERGRL